MRSKRTALVALAVAALAAPAAAQGNVLTGQIRDKLIEVTALQKIEVLPGGGYASQATVQCESGGDYSIDTGNGYYGGYQFLQDTWDRWAPDAYVGVRPSEVPPAVQDAVAQSIPGDQWPNCP